MKFLNVIQKVFKIARVLTLIAICLFFIAAGYELTLVAIELLTHGSKAIDKHLIAHALEHLVHFVANGILLVFVFKYIKHEIHDGTPYTEEGAKELKEIGIHIIVHPIITAAIIAIMDVALGQKFPSFFTGTTYIGVLLGAVLVVVSLILKYGAELENNIKNNNSDKKDE